LWYTESVMSALQSIFLFVFGICIGSFLNCVVWRLNHDCSPLRGRSFCPKCKHKLGWKDNIPLLSFVLLRGKCRYCRSPISWQYPIVELATGILTVVSFQLSVVRGEDSLSTVYWLLITYALITLFVSDLRYQTIPDEIVFPAIILAILYSILYSPFSILNSLLAGAGAAGFFLFLVMVTRGRGMGMGDVKLVALMGLVLGWPKIIVALFLAFLTGAFIGVILILLGKKRFGQHIPFGPFLTSATLISLFWGGLIWQWYLEKIMG